MLVDQIAERLKRNLIIRYPDSEKAIDRVFKCFQGEDALDEIIIQSEEKNQV